MSSVYRSLSILSLFLLPLSLFAQQRPPDLTRTVSAALGAQGRLMWVDGTANIFRKIKKNGEVVWKPYTTTREGVVEIVRHCQAAHINTLVIDVKPLSGEVLYRSKIAPRMRTWQGHEVPDFDVLAAFIEEGHKAGIRVHASVNILSEGHKYYDVGPAYKHPDWQSIVYTLDRGMVAESGGRLPVRVPGEPGDPAKPALLTDDDTLLGGDPAAGIGLESVDSGRGLLNGQNEVMLGQQVAVTLSANNRVEGVIDNALLGDDPLIASENGHLITATRQEDSTWITRNLKPGMSVRFDLRTGRTPIAKAPSEKVACFVNVLHPEARRYELDMVREIVTNYSLDGFVLDRCRHSNIYNDFSDITKEAFAKWLPSHSRDQKRINRWPEDTFAFSPVPGSPIIPGPLYKQWMEFRAENIRDFVAEVSKIVRSTKPGITLGTYVGSWYPKYHEVGVNWGSEKNRLRYSFLSDTYPRTGYADFFDWISTGCYHPVPMREDARRAGMSERGSVEYLADQSNIAVANSAFVYGGIYVPDYQNHPAKMLRALEAASRQSQGWMIFDISYIDEFNWWPVLERAYPQAVPSPDQLSDLLPALRAAMDEAKP